MIPELANKKTKYVDAVTGALLFIDESFDPGLSWGFGKQGWVIFTAYGCGEPLDWWLAANPRPAT